MWEWLEFLIQPITALWSWTIKRPRSDYIEEEDNEKLDDDTAVLKRRKVEPEEQQQQEEGRIILMRHSIRVDTNGIESVPESVWPDKNERPYDPPICDVDLPRESAEKLKKYNIKRIVSSPYRRCLQTSGIVARELGVTQVDIDDGLGEWFREVQRCRSAADVETYSAASPLPLEQMQQELGSKVTIGNWARVEISDTDTWFLVPRVHKAISSIIKSNPSSTTLIITHGDIANRWLPEADYMPEYSYLRLHEAGYVVLKASNQRSTSSDIIEVHRTEAM